MLQKDLARTIRRLRTEAGIGLRELSRLADVSPASLTAIEKGRSSPTLATLHKILKALNTSFAQFFANAHDTPQRAIFPRNSMRSAADEYREYTFLIGARPNKRFAYCANIM